ncbi:MAG: LCP family protein, partial [Anaerolineae bacterium]
GKEKAPPAPAPSISQSELTVPAPARERDHAADVPRSLDLTEPAPANRDRSQENKDKTRPARSQPPEVARQIVASPAKPVATPPQPQSQPKQSATTPPIQQVRPQPPQVPAQTYTPAPISQQPQVQQQPPQQPAQPTVQRQIAPAAPAPAHGQSQPQSQPQPPAAPAIPPTAVASESDYGSYRRPRQNWAVVALAVLALVSTVMFGIASLIGVRLVNAGREVADAASHTPAATSLPTFDMPPPTVGVQIVPWDGQERFTVLMMGLDKRPGENGTAFRTDSMIIVSIDPGTKSVGLLSVPRDLYIEIPPDTVVGYGYGLQRVNSAYVIGELARTGYGPQLAMQTVQYNLGMRIHDYVVFDFSTVIDAVNAVGGIDIDVQSAINDPSYPNMYYGYDPLYIPAGHIHMDGELALKYARSRHGSSDFDRAKRQQEVITALRDKILNGNMLPDLLVQAPNLWTNMSRSLKTGLSLDQILRLAVYLKDVPAENIKHGVLDTNYVTPTMWDGASVLVPNRATIGPLLVQVFGANYNQ